MLDLFFLFYLLGGAYGPPPLSTGLFSFIYEELFQSVDVRPAAVCSCQLIYLVVRVGGLLFHALSLICMPRASIQCNVIVPFSRP